MTLSSQHPQPVASAVTRLLLSDSLAALALAVAAIGGFEVLGKIKEKPMKATWGGGGGGLFSLVSFFSFFPAR